VRGGGRRDRISSPEPCASKRRRKRNPVPGVYLGHPVPGGHKYGDLALKVGGVSRIWIINSGPKPRGTQIREGLRWRGLAATVNYRPILSSEGARQNNKPATV
jgi:hypothetical protein